MKYYYISTIIIGVMSLITFLAYAIDKLKAEHGAWRVPEKVLLSMSFLFGGVGGYLSMFICRHKIRKWYFHVVNILGIVISVGFTVGMLYLDHIISF